MGSNLGGLLPGSGFSAQLYELSGDWLSYCPKAGEWLEYHMSAERSIYFYKSSQVQVATREP
jgi:hypothetical protein